MKTILRSLSVCVAMTLATAGVIDLSAAPAFAEAAQSTGSTTSSVLGYAMTGAGLVLAIAAVPLAYYGVQFVAKLAQGVGISVDATMKAALQQQVVNGINWAAAELSKRGTTIDKDSLVGKVADYVRAHGGDIIKGLGLDPNSAHFTESIAARTEKALNDPQTPTPEKVTPPAGMPAG